MSNNPIVVRSGGLGFLGALQLLLIAGKIFGFIGASWFWVLIPIWGPLVFGLSLMLLALLIKLYIDTH